MTFRSFLGRIRWRTLEAFCRRDFNLSGSGPIVSFTFDDFPQSALQIGGSILKSYEVRGTYYAAMGLMDQITDLGRQFSATDLEIIHRDGHELGSHTFGHLSGRSSSFRNYKANVMEGLEAVSLLTSGGKPQQFSYPYGHITLRAKREISDNFSSCRGIMPGINKSPVDLNLLRANSLYSCSIDFKVIERLFIANDKCKGWLIFYTHDVSEKPSPFGCKPGEFESVVKLAISSQAAILPVGQVVLGVSG
jgi:peptidoglycan/xylan/chitin deacetylase (PgdA/CDA1 family)